MGQGMPRLRLGTRLRLLWGKVRRLYLGKLRPAYVRQSAARRHGECRRCGACCKLGLRCRRLDEDATPATCVRHESRPMNCRVFPIDERDLADRDLVCPDAPCGYCFDGLPAADDAGPAADVQEQAVASAGGPPVGPRQTIAPQPIEIDRC